MRTEVYVRDDIENVLKAIDQANRDLITLVRSTEADIYRSGFAAALQAVATAFNVRLTSEPRNPDHPASLPLYIIDRESMIK
jgi:hypothetical protein